MPSHRHAARRRNHAHQARSVLPLLLGLVLAFVGGFVFQMAGWKLNLGNEWLEQVVIAFVGAIIVVIIARIIV